MRGAGDTAVLKRLRAEPAPGDEAEALWDRAYEQQLFSWASAQVRPRVAAHNWQAFWRTAVEGQSVRASL